MKASTRHKPSKYKLTDVLREFRIVEDIRFIIDTMVPGEMDIKEAEAITGCFWTEALINTIVESDKVFTIIHPVTGKQLGFLGVVEHDKELKVAIPWCFLDEGIEECRKDFLKLSKVFLEEILLFEYNVLANYTLTENHRTIRWLTWLGFTIKKDRPTTFAKEDEVFYPFILEKPGFLEKEDA